MPRVHSPGQRACLGAESTLGRRSPAYVFDGTHFHPPSPRQPHGTPLRARVAPAPAQKQGQNPRVCMGTLPGSGRSWGTKLPGEPYSPAVDRYAPCASAELPRTPQDPR